MMPPAKIVVVDDNPVVLTKLAHLLRSAGHEVVEAASAAECLQRVRESSPDLALLDVILPDLHGVELCRRIKSDPDLRQVFVVLLSTTEVATERQASGLEAGADGYIARPMESRELLARVESLLRIQRAEAALRAAQAELERRVDERTAELSRANAALREEIKTRREAEASLGRHAERLRVLHSIDQSILAARSPEDIAEAALSRVRGLLPHEEASVWEIVEARGEARALAVSERGEVRTGGGVVFPLTALTSSRAFQSSQPYRLTRSANLFAPQATRRPGGKEWKALLDLPLVADQRLIGVLNFATDELAAFTREQQDIAQELAAQLAVALRQARLFAEVFQGREHLRALSLRLVEVQEAERRFIAHELHDEVGQMLTGLKLQLDLCAPQATGALRQSLKEAGALIHELLEQVRQLSLDLRPQILDDLGLLTALDWYFKRFQQQTDIRVSFATELPPARLPSHLETALFRIVQEALTNAARHSGAETITVRLWPEAAGLRLRIEDRGKGFDTTRATGGISSGLAGMRERAQLLGGRFTITSAPGQGTRLEVELPHDPMRADAGPKTV